MCIHTMMCLQAEIPWISAPSFMENTALTSWWWLLHHVNAFVSFLASLGCVVHTEKAQLCFGHISLASCFPSVDVGSSSNKQKTRVVG